MRYSASGAARSADSGVADPRPDLKAVASGGNGKHPPEPPKSREEQLDELWKMTPAERQAAMWADELSGTQLIEWARRAPKEVPLINNEWAFIAAHTPEVADAMERSR